MNMDSKGRDKFLSKMLEEIRLHDVIPQRNKDLIIKFFNEKVINGRKTLGMEHYIKIVKRLCEKYPKEFDLITKDEVIDFFLNLKPEPILLKTRLRTYITQTKEYAQTSLNVYKNSLKTFYIWVSKELTLVKDDKGVPLQVSWIKYSGKVKFKREKEVLSREEIQKMIKYASNPRDKALITVLFETGMRLGELQGMQVDKIFDFESYGQTKISGKTGEREVIFIQSWPYLKDWLNWIRDNNYNISDAGKNLVWISFPKVGVARKHHKESGHLMTQDAVNIMLKKTAKRAGINKRIWAHGFRHSSATDFVKQGYTEPELRVKYGWTETSSVPSNYTHYKFEDLRDKMLFKSGKGKAQDTLASDIIKNKFCPFCDTSNPFEAKYCIKCSRPLNLETIKSREKEQAAYKFMNTLLSRLDEMQKQGVEITRINQALENWVKEETTSSDS